MGCFAAWKIAAAFSMPTVSSRGAWKISSGRFSAAIRSARRAPATSSRNCRRMVNLRPASVTSASPVASIVPTSAAKFFTTCAASAGAPMVTTARASGMSPAAASTAAPPSEWPTSSAGAARVARRWSAAATRSATFEEKLVLANSPSLAPRPVKSKRSTAMPRPASASAMRAAAKMSFEQVKQCAKTA